MTGSEKTGYANGSVRLLENAYYMLTPTTLTPQPVTEYMTALVKELGAIPVVCGGGHGCDALHFHVDGVDGIASLGGVNGIAALNGVDGIASLDGVRGKLA